MDTITPATQMLTLIINIEGRDGRYTRAINGTEEELFAQAAAEVRDRLKAVLVECEVYENPHEIEYWSEATSMLEDYGNTVEDHKALVSAWNDSVSMQNEMLHEQTSFDVVLAESPSTQ